MEQIINDKKRRKWSREQTAGFLRYYLARKEEFLHPKKKRLAFSNVLEDMVSIGIADVEMTPLCLEAKMRTLLNAYKAARDNNRRTGAAPCFAPYMELMDEIYGNSPIISNTHTIHVGSRPAQILPPSPSPSPSPPSRLPPSPSPPSRIQPPPSPSLLPPPPSPSLLSPSSTPSPPPPMLRSSPTQILSSPSPQSQMLPAAQTPPPILPSSPSPVSSTSTNIAPPARRKRSPRELYYEKKLELKKLEAEEKRKSRAESLQYFKELLRQKFERDAEMDRKKLELMEKWVNK